MSLASGIRYLSKVIRSDGLLAGLDHIRRRGRHKLTTDYQIEKRRKQLSARFTQQFGATVAYGPFKGLRLADDAWWGNDDAAVYFGLYELEILNELTNMARGGRTFVNLGAANGYYGVGALVANMCDRSICFELSAEGRKIIERTARLNGVLDRVEIRGAAGDGFYQLIPEADRDRAIVLIDIEGAEFELLTTSFFEAFSNSTIFVELHQRTVPNGLEKLVRLRETASRNFQIKEMRTGPRDPGQFPELEQLSDSDRWLLCSEGRPFLMDWWRLDPKLRDR